jgi:hypothetical protein
MHSWSLPRLGTAMDALYGPHASKHEPEPKGLSKVQSQHTSLAVVLDICKGYAPDLVFVSRHDLMLTSSLPVNTLLVDRVYLPSFCMPVFDKSSAHHVALSKVCAGANGHLLMPYHVSRNAPFPRTQNVSKVGFGSFVPDYFFIANLSVSQSFASLANSTIYQHHLHLGIRAAKHAGGRFNLWTHYFWAFHIANAPWRRQVFFLDAPFNQQHSFTSPLRWYLDELYCEVGTQPHREDAGTWNALSSLHARVQRWTGLAS